MSTGLPMVRVPVADLRRARRFYAEVLGLREEPMRRGCRNPRFRTGARVVVLHPAPVSPPGLGPPVRRDTRVVIAVSDFTYEYQRLCVAGAQFLGKVQPLPGGGWRGRIVDPDGNVLTLVETPR